LFIKEKKKKLEFMVLERTLSLITCIHWKNYEFAPYINFILKHLNETRRVEFVYCHLCLLDGVLQGQDCIDCFRLSLQVVGSD
jgi:hypothetical protein